MPIAREFRDAGATIRAALGPLASQLRWVPAGALHLTLRFLGEVTPSDVERAADAARVAAAAVSPFSITLAGGGAFPSLREPRVLWVGVADGAALLAALARALEAALVVRGFVPEGRPFQPHLTVARARSAGRLPDLRARVSELGWPHRPVIGIQRVDAVVVIESTLHASGSAYRDIFRAMLGAAVIGGAK